MSPGCLKKYNDLLCLLSFLMTAQNSGFCLYTLLMEDTLAKKKMQDLCKLTTVIRIIWQQPEYECTKITSLVTGKQNLA